MAAIILANANEDDGVEHEFLCSDDDAEWLASMLEMLSTAIQWEIRDEE